MAPAAVILVAAGSGRRFGRPKAFVPVGGRAMLGWSLRACDRLPVVGTVVVVARAGDLARARRLAARHRNVAVVAGGATRRASVAAGLAAVPRDVRWVLVHDAARPLARPSLFAAVLRAARRTGAAAPGRPVSDTLKLAHRGGAARGRGIARTVSREGLWAVQTPQAFRRDLLERAHARAGRNGFAGAETDDAVLVERLGARVALVPGPRTNLKITTPEDRAIADALLRHRV